MKVKKKSKRANGGKATLKKYGKDHFRDLARRQHEKYFGQSKPNKKNGST